MLKLLLIASVNACEGLVVSRGPLLPDSLLLGDTYLPLCLERPSPFTSHVKV